MTTLQVEYAPEELLATAPISEPLVVGGVVCHGGFDDDGAYVSPRTLNRGPAIEAWRAKRAEEVGTPLLEAPLDAWPEHYPNVAQSAYLLSEGVREPLSSTLTRIGTVEGFGAMIRHATVPDLQRVFDEDVRGTALAHLTRGLFEAHGRDEAGWEEEAGHKEMWFAARDVALEHPPTEDETAVMMARMGPPAGSGAERLWPADTDPELELLVGRLIRILLIEVQAFHTFAWAEALLADADLVAGEGEAARLVSYIRADETPHVGYLSTVLSEVRDRTVLGSSGRRYAGTDLVGRLWDRATATSLGAGRAAAVKVAREETAAALEGHRRGREILERFDELGSAEVAA